MNRINLVEHNGQDTQYEYNARMAAVAINTHTEPELLSNISTYILRHIASTQMAEQGMCSRNGTSDNKNFLKHIKFPPTLQNRKLIVSHINGR